MSFFSGFGIGDALGSLFGLANTGVNIALQNKQNKFNAEQAQLNRNFQREMWSANNEYNTPTKQVARLVDAGLNPALAYGQVTSGTSSSSPSGSQAQSAGNIESGLANAFGLYATAQQLKMQKQQTDADIKVKAAQAKAFDSEAEKNQASVRQKDTELFNNFRQFQLDFGQRITEYSDFGREKGISEVNLNRANEANFRASSQYQSAQTAKTMQDISNSIRALDQLDKQLQIDAKNADTNAYNARTNRINAQTSARAVDVQAQSVQVTQLLGLLNWHTTNTAQELKNVGQKLQNKFDRMTLADRTAVVKATLQHYREQIVYLQKQNKWFDIQQINQQINLLVNTFKQGTESYKNITEGVRNIVGMIPIVGKLMR